MSTSEYHITRRQQLISSLSRNDRYDLDSDYGSESNLIPTSVMKARRQIASYDMSQKTIDIYMAEQ